MAIDLKTRMTTCIIRKAQIHETSLTYLCPGMEESRSAGGQNQGVQHKQYHLQGNHNKTQYICSLGAKLLYNLLCLTVRPKLSPKRYGEKLGKDLIQRKL